MAVPFTFKWATDALADPQSAHETSWIGWALAAPVVLTLAYGGTRILMALLTQLRDGLSARVAMLCGAPARLDHLRAHASIQSCAIISSARRAGLSRVIERGRTGIENIVRFATINILPTIVELALYLGMLLLQFDWRYALIVLATTVGSICGSPSRPPSGGSTFAGR